MEKWYVGKSSIAGRGAFTSRPIQKGEIIDIGINYLLFVPYVTEFGSWINHEWDPNSVVKYDLNDDVYYVRALKYLPANTEITVDYKETPNYISGPEDWYF
uniref:SET domain protein n=1 Tax=Marseillevirus LCMAC101 TaxID=2506602 RepID=A0A481YSP5_9VIRU|nr:MAG: SET domain protein [Marseillevirus LCMAC101]